MGLHDPPGRRQRPGLLPGGLLPAPLQPLLHPLQQQRGSPEEALAGAGGPLALPGQGGLLPHLPRPQAHPDGLHQLRLSLRRPLNAQQLQGQGRQGGLCRAE